MATYDFARPVNVIAPELLDLINSVKADLDKPIVYFTAPAISVVEGNSGNKVLTYTARRSSIVGALNVPGNYVAGTANAADFPNGLPGNKVWAFVDGSDTATVDIMVAGDTVVESNDTFGYQLAAGTGYRLGSPSSCTGTILNDDTAAQPITITPQTAAFSDSFVGDGQLNARANWAVGTGEETWWATSAGSLLYNKQYGGTARAIYAADMTGNFDVVMEYNTSMEGPDQGSGEFANRTDFNLCYKDASNYIRVNYGPLFDRISIWGVVGGTQGAIYTFLRPSESAPRHKGTLRFAFANGVLRVAFDGVWCKRASQALNYPVDRVTLANIGIPANIQSGRFALTASTWRYARLDGIATYAGQITMDTDDEFVGRDSVTATGGTWTGTGTYTGFTFAQAAVRIIDFKTGSVVADWAAPKAVTAANGAYSVSAFLPMGGPYTVELALNGSDGVSRIIQSRPVLSGYHVLYYGQSNSLGRSGIYDAAVRGDRYATFVMPNANQDSNFPAGHFASTLTDFRSSASMGLARAAAPLLNIPVAVTTCGAPATPISGLVPGTGGWSDLVARVGSLKGIIEITVWDQGEGDADGAQATSNYVAQFRDQLVPGLREVGRNPNMKVLIAPFGNFPGGKATNGSADASEILRISKQRETIRQAHQTLVDTVAGVGFSSFKLGAHHGSDSYHYLGSSYYDPLCTRDGYTVAKALGATTFDGRGPQVTGASRNGVTITLTIDRNGATGVTGPVDVETFTGTYGSAPANSFKGYEVSADDFATNLPISSIAVSGDNLVITLTSAPAGAVKVRSFTGLNYDDRSLFVGSYTGGLTIPVAPIIKYLTA